MPQFINTNVASLNTQRALNMSQSALQTSLQRLSSGLRINSAKDDAAGLAISDRMTSQIRGLNQAVRNANDGISLAQTAEGALGEITNNLQRVRELAVQSANATNSASDRAALDQEVQQLLAEIDRVASQTSFNGQNVIDGTFGNATFQVGDQVGQTITIGLSTSMRSADIGKTADYVNSTTAYSSASAVGQQGTGVDGNALGSGAMTVALGTSAAVSIGASVDNTSSGAGRTAASAYSKAAAIDAAGIGGLTVDADTTAQVNWSNVTTTNTAYSLSLNGTAIYTAIDTSATGTNTALTGDAVAAAINSNASATGVTATYDSVNTRMTLSATDGRDIAISQTTTAETGTGLGAFEGTNNATVTAGTAPTTLTTAVAATTTLRGSIRLTAASGVTLGGTPTAIGYTAASMALGNSAINSASVTTVANSETMLTRVDAALTSVSSLRSTFGAIQNRFDSVISNLQATSENVTAARSRIRDTDFAAETAELTRNQILQQAGIAMLSQANAAPQSVLALLQ